MTIIRDHVLAGRSFSSLTDLDNAFLAWGADPAGHVAVPTGRDHNASICFVLMSLATWQHHRDR